MAKRRSKQHQSASDRSAEPSPNRLATESAVLPADLPTEAFAPRVKRPLPAALFALLAASFLLALLFALRVPLDTNPDEQAHIDYVRLLVENGGFVRFVKGDPAYYETHQPPLYYLLATVPYRLFGGSFQAVRLVNVGIQVLTVFLTFVVTRDLFRSRHTDTLALAAAAFVAFLPTQAQLGGAITNDPLTTLLCVGMFWKMGRIPVRGQTATQALIVAALIALGLYTKLSVLQLLPVLLVAFLLGVRNGAISLRDAVVRFATSVGLGIALASPWLVRNTLLYGDPLTLGIYRDTGINYSPSQIMEAAGWSLLDYLRNVGVRSYATFWYLLPPDLPFPRFTGNPLLLAIVLVLGLAGAVGVYLGMKRQQFDLFERRTLGLLAIGLTLIAPFFVRFVLTVFQAQGRYFLPALLPAAVLCATGWAILFARNESAGAKLERSFGLGAFLPAGVCLILSVYQLMMGGFAR